jgi:hypothetical protein
MSKFITATLGALTLLTCVLLGVGLFGSEYASDQQFTLLGLSFLTGSAANILGIWALSR